MLTAETSVNPPRKPSKSRTLDRWYDPDSVVFQAAGEASTDAGTLPGPRTGDVPTQARRLPEALTTRG